MHEMAIDIQQGITIRSVNHHVATPDFIKHGQGRLGHGAGAFLGLPSRCGITPPFLPKARGDSPMPPKPHATT
jgi:hypothetical protein